MVKVTRSLTFVKCLIISCMMSNMNSLSLIHHSKVKMNEVTVKHTYNEHGYCEFTFIMKFFNTPARNVYNLYIFSTFTANLFISQFTAIANNFSVPQS